MACCMSPEDSDRKKASDDIDKLLVADRDKLRRTVKVLLLGAGESGKSTFLKQMRIIHGEDFKESDCLEFRSIIYTNLMKAAKVLIQARELLGIAWGDETNSRHADLIAAAATGLEQYTEMAPYFAALEELWLDSGIQETFACRSKFHIGDSTEYFFKKIKEIGETGYVPTKQDVLCSRKATRGIHEYDILIRKVPFKFVDVGGQRSQRTKWFQCFDEMTALIFFASGISIYESLLEANGSHDFAGDAILKEFGQLVDVPFFPYAYFVAVVSKWDLVQEKMASVIQSGQSIPSPEGHDVDLRDLESVRNFLFKRFRPDHTYKNIQCHFVTATDQESIEWAFEAIRSTVLSSGLGPFRSTSILYS